MAKTPIPKIPNATPKIPDKNSLCYTKNSRQKSFNQWYTKIPDKNLPGIAKNPE